MPLKIVISCLKCIDSSVCRLRVERSKRVFGSLIGIKCWFGVYRLYEVGGYSSFDDTLNLFCFRIWSIHSIVNRSIYTATAGAVHGTHGTFCLFFRESRTGSETEAITTSLTGAEETWWSVRSTSSRAPSRASCGTTSSRRGHSVGSGSTAPRGPVL